MRTTRPRRKPTNPLQHQHQRQRLRGPSTRAATQPASRPNSSRPRGNSTRRPAQLRAHQGEIGRYRETDNLIKRHLQQQSGYVVEQNGRYRYENLSAKVLDGSASTDEAEEVAQMTQWHKFAAPIYRAAEDVVLGSFKADWNSLKDLEGIGDNGLQRLNKAQSVVQAAREVHNLSLAAGEAKAKAKYEAQIAKLRAENKSLKTQTASRGPQPAIPNGTAVPANGSLMRSHARPQDRSAAARVRPRGLRRQMAGCRTRLRLM